MGSLPHGTYRRGRNKAQQSLSHQEESGKYHMCSEKDDRLWEKERLLSAGGRVGRDFVEVIFDLHPKRSVNME